MDEIASFEPQLVLAPKRRRGNVVGIAVAAVVVAMTVGVGVLGPRTDDASREPAVAPDASTAVAVASPEPAPTTAPVTSAPLPLFPANLLGLQVWSAAYVSTYGLNYFGGSIAVAGWYAPLPGTGCPTPRVAEDPSLAEEFGVAADANTFCQRTGSLFTAPTFGENVPPIGIRLRPGVAAPYEFKDGSMVLPVVFVGTLVNHGSRCHTPNACPNEMVVDRVAWAAGAGLSETESVLPKLLDHWPPLGADERDSLAVRAIGYRGDVLLETLVDLATLATVDVHAAEVVTAAAPDAERIWYRRILGPDPAADPMHWVGIDDATGELIAFGSGS